MVNYPKPKTELGASLLDMRRRIVESGAQMLDWDGIQMYRYGDGVIVTSTKMIGNFNLSTGERPRHRCWLFLSLPEPEDLGEWDD